MEAIKHRTQISLDDWQYQTLLDLSRKSKKSLSALIREMITEKFAPKPGVAENDRSTPLSESAVADKNIRPAITMPYYTGRSRERNFCRYQRLVFPGRQR